jgi:hypothetical protein
MKILNQTITILAICGLSVATAGAQNLAVFKIPESGRPFLFNLSGYTSQMMASTNNSVRQGVEGSLTILAKGFKTERRTGVVVVTLHDAVVCTASHSSGGGAWSQVFSTDEYPLMYHPDTRILVRGKSMLLADLSVKTFDPPATPSHVYEGEAAIKKLKEMGLEPPEDMDWEQATNHGHSQLDGAANRSQPVRSGTNRTSAAAGPGR